MVRKYPCMCDPCLNDEGECENPFVGAWRKVTLLHGNEGMSTEDHDTADDALDADEEVVSEEDLATIAAAQAGIESTVSEGTLVVVRPDEEMYDYYIIKAGSPVKVLETPMKDDYGHFYDTGSKVLQGH